MLIERPPLLYRLLFPEALWRLKRKHRKTVYLTFDDGPNPNVTPWVLDVLDTYGIKGTFFMVGDNVRRHPELYGEIVRRGHSYGNHTYHHLQGMKVSTRKYLRDITEARRLIDSPLFRPPHGLMRWKQARIIKNHYNIVMYDLVTRDYSRKVSPRRVLTNVKLLVRNGAIIVFHDSDKSSKNIRHSLCETIEYLKGRGFDFAPLPM